MPRPQDSDPVKQRVSQLILAACVMCCLPVSVLAREPVYCSPVFLVADDSGRNLYVADETGMRVVQVDSTERKLVRSFSLPESPTGIAVDQSAEKLYVTSRSPEGSVFVIDLRDGTIVSTLKAGHTPVAPVLAADGSTLYVCNRFESSVSIIDLASGKSVKEIDLVREPVAAALTNDGSTLVVLNHKSSDTAEGFEVASAVSVIDVSTATVAHVRLPGGSVNCRGICISPDDRYAFVSHILARNHLPATQLDRGWLITNAVSVIDLAKKKLLGAVILDDIDRGAANPWGLACTPDGGRLCVAIAGVHEIVVIELPEMLERMRKSSYGVRGADGEVNVDLWYEESTYAQLGFLRDIRKRVVLGGRSPRHIAVIGDRLFAGMFFSGILESIELGDLDAVPESIELSSEPPLTLQRRGELLFNDATICFQGWQSCASCHPDGRADGLNWDLTNDGIGNFKNAKSLLFADRTTPSTMTGVFESLEECVRVEITTILFAGPQDENARAIVSYLRSLRPLPSPYLERGADPGLGRLSASARRGREVFGGAGCAKCHAGEYFTAREIKNVGTYVAGDHRKSFDIPSLREVWRTAPYLHDGRARTVEEVLTKFNPDGKHGDTSDLTAGEIADLVEYVRSL